MPITPSQAVPDTLSLYAFLPDFVQANDAAGGYQFLSWLDGFMSMGSNEPTLTYAYAYNSDGTVTLLPQPYTVNNVPVPAAVGLQAIDDIIRDSPYNPGWSILMDINRCPTYALPWLAQFLGVRFSQPSTDAAMRAAIVQESPFDRGTPAYIAYQADLEMQFPYAVTLMERTSYIGDAIGYDPYAVTVMYPRLGVGALTYSQLFAEYSNYNAVEAGFPEYEDMYGNTFNLENAVLAVMPAGLFVYFYPY